MDKLIITIGRQYGSGGHLIGEKLADALGIGFYDKELIYLSAKQSGFSENIFIAEEERPTNSLLYALAMGAYPMTGMVLDQPSVSNGATIYSIQADVIRNVAQSSCVIVGRCSDFILKNEPGLVSVFLHSNMEASIERAVNLYKVPRQEATNLIRKTNKRRAGYYNFYTNRTWSDARNYDLALDTSNITLDDATEIILAYIQKRRGSETQA